ncbi:MAG: hypothetical protein KatS3mg087_1220 [Patescibacteria group bacterium]|nr:MAG: hypothetical protein KatS3mg087_1220 [Patescibacteria group bacterium]
MRVFIVLFVLVLTVGCSADAADTNLIGKNVTFTNVTQVDPLSVVGGYWVTATVVDGDGVSFDIFVMWQKGLLPHHFEHAHATIVSVGEGLEFGKMNLLGFGQINWRRR